MNRTDNLRLAKPEGTEGIDIDLLNENADVLDLEVSRRVKLVNGAQPDENGNVDVSQVAFAENLVAEDAQQIGEEFLFRTTGGSASLTDGDAMVIALRGRMIHTGYAEEQLNMTVTPATRPAGSESIIAALDRDVFVAYVNNSGTITLTYTNAWSANPTLYGVTVTGTPVSGDRIVITYVKEARGTITVAQPTAFRSTGWNLYNPSTGYARVKKYAGTAQYRIEGLYTSVTFSSTVNGSRTSVTTRNGYFTISEDGYIWVAGSGANTAVYATWSDWTNGHPGDYEAYREDVINLASVMSNYFPYGLCCVGGVADEINLNAGYAISKITRTAYSAANLEQIKQSGRMYEYDESYIYSVKAAFETHEIAVDGAFTASDHGTEMIDGSTVPVYVQTLYGQNLRDKLRTDVVTISSQELTDEQKAQVRTNIGAEKARGFVNITTQFTFSSTQGTIAGSAAYKIGPMVTMGFLFTTNTALSAGQQITINYSTNAKYQPVISQGVSTSHYFIAGGDINWEVIRFSASGSVPASTQFWVYCTYVCASLED